MDSERRRLYESKQNDSIIYQRNDTYHASQVFLKELSCNNGNEDAEVVAGVVRALSKKKYKKHLLKAVEADLPDLCGQLENKLYKQLREKFKPWVCLRELDLAATVSLRGYDVIRRIEFHEEENSKYKRGLFQSRFQLTRLSHELEAYAKTILPFDLTTNSVKFNIPVAVNWLMEKHGLWEYVLDGDTVTMAATVDGGALAWKRTQVSAGIKFCDERTINPCTGRLLFGDSECRHFHLVSKLSRIHDIIDAFVFFPIFGDTFRII